MINDEEFSVYQAGDYLSSPVEAAAYLEAVLDEYGDDPAHVALALGELARSSNLSEIARRTGLSREGLYKSLVKGGNPSFSTVMKVSRALGLTVRFEAAAA